ncbi:hypothetical protein P175DRAFT_0498115 [Aspergillus ochraceoroseus IBT 24754]|uniref:Cytochrome b5 heme-binding domain-containing protein n=2 Tax=Aspergillus ochraceoroseus TaxID=138278 RepID=A0A2T5M920_9EURO|nr:uncharacterized protein P175DRAFT_0498115 [Aspergillus ochraceoroseus IBT 24754]KKK20395.1 hypothetical protein AOCH_005454 [Aspergillus ochraceoroseus]PTU25014.1 hypothetical protein P175DRAFT_0498115 [Aspergillus ochraceoroseus IBT 24754]
MGWVGVATLVATTCFLLYRHPPASWFPSLPTPPTRTESTSGKELPTRTTEEKKTKNDIINDSQVLVEEDQRVEESQTTPKASASNAPSLQVPSLQLDNTTDKIPVKEPAADLPQTPNGSMHPPPIILAPTDTMTQTSQMSPSQAPATGGSSLMPPPPPPSRLRPTSKQPQSAPLALTAGRYPPQISGRPSSNSTLSPPPSAAASLRVPQNSRPTGSTLAPIPVLKPSKKSSQRPILEPGFSPLDWAALTSNPNNKLRGANLPPTLIRVTPSMLKAQHGRKGTDAWTSYQGKVYNITPYLPFHPGGKGELLRGAGKDSGKLFMEIHPWVNWDAILGECLVGILVSENDSETSENSLDAMD